MEALQLVGTVHRTGAETITILAVGKVQAIVELNATINKHIINHFPGVAMSMSQKAESVLLSGVQMREEVHITESGKTKLTFVAYGTNLFSPQQLR